MAFIYSQRNIHDIADNNKVGFQIEMSSCGLIESTCTVGRPLIQAIITTEPLGCVLEKQVGDSLLRVCE